MRTRTGRRVQQFFHCLEDETATLCHHFACKTQGCYLCQRSENHSYATSTGASFPNIRKRRVLVHCLSPLLGLFTTQGCRYLPWQSFRTGHLATQRILVTRSQTGRCDERIADLSVQAPPRKQACKEKREGAWFLVRCLYKARAFEATKASPSAYGSDVQKAF